MKTYRVGGSVRDQLLGKTPKDFDYVVVGATVVKFVESWPERYHISQIGSAFPVFLVVDPYEDWKGEFAFARRERKVGTGHKGFEVESDPSVTLEEDLSRRDLTINAMACSYHEALTGYPHVIDPFNGAEDLKNKILRHVGPAFAEDPLRVYRLARFAAQLGFAIAPETLELAATMKPELYSLSAERVAEETRKAMRSENPRRFFEVLASLCVLDVWHPELNNLIGVPAGPPGHHDELDAFVHTMMVLGMVPVSENTDLDVETIRWAALTHDLGKAYTPKENWPRHHDHEGLGVVPVERFYDRLKLPTHLKAAAVLACTEHLRVHRFLEMGTGKMVDLVRAADKTKLRAEGLALVAMADAFGRIAINKKIEGPNAVLACADAIREETGHPIPESLHGEHIGLHIRSKKGNAARRALKEKGYL